MPKFTRKDWNKVVLLSAAGLLTGFTAGKLEIEPELVKSFFSEAAQNQITQAGFFFTLAAWMHSTRVKKEIKLNFESLTTAINQLGEAFREDLKIQRDRIDNLAQRVQTLEVVKKVEHHKE